MLDLVKKNIYIYLIDQHISLEILKSIVLMIHVIVKILWSSFNI